MNEKLKIQLANYVGLYQSMETPEPVMAPSKPALGANEKKVFEEAARAWENYRQSPEGKRDLAAAEKMDLPALLAYVPTILDHPAFKKLLELLQSLDLPASSFSMGLNFEAELVIGFSATIGVAIGVGDSKGVQSAEFLTVSLIGGVEAGIMVGVEFGLWSRVPADLGGRMTGTEVAVGFEVEGSVAIFYTLKELIGAILTIGIGVEEGVAEVECYTFILGSQGEDAYIKPVYQPKRNNLLIIDKLTCVHPANDGGGDENEIYFTFRPDGGENTTYPYPTYDYFSMKEGDTWACGRSIWFNERVDVFVFDEDTPGNDDDEVGSFAISLSNLQLNQSVTFRSVKDYSSGMDKVEYTIQVRLIAQNVGH
jgi:hypothetical protein